MKGFIKFLVSLSLCGIAQLDASADSLAVGVGFGVYSPSSNNIFLSVEKPFSKYVSIGINGHYIFADAPVESSYAGAIDFKIFPIEFIFVGGLGGIELNRVKEGSGHNKDYSLNLGAQAGFRLILDDMISFNPFYQYIYVNDVTAKGGSDRNYMKSHFAMSVLFHF